MFFITSLYESLNFHYGEIQTRDFGIIPDEEELSISAFSKNFILDSSIPDGKDQIRSFLRDLMPKNTIILNNEIICKDGYINSSDIKWKGCWKCDLPCSIHASCIDPGICVCNYPYSGNGFECHEPTLSIIDTAIIEDDNFISIDFLPEVPLDSKIFGYFSGIKAPCTLKSSHTLICSINVTSVYNKNISLSFNHKTESEKIMITELSNYIQIKEVYKFFIYGVIGAILLKAAQIYFNHI